MDLDFVVIVVGVGVLGNDFLLVFDLDFLLLYFDILFLSFVFGVVSVENIVNAVVVALDVCAVVCVVCVGGCVNIDLVVAKVGLRVKVILAVLVGMVTC